MIFTTCCFGSVLLSAPAFAWDTSTSGSGPQAVAETAPAQAQEQSAHSRSTSTSTSASTSTSYSKSASHSSSKATGGKATGGSSSVVVNGVGSGSAGYDGGRFPVAGAYAPSFAGASPCDGRAMSGGGQGSILGLSLGIQQMDSYCQVERLGNMQSAGQRIDFAWQCLRRGDEFRKAAANAGYPCPQAAEPKPQPVAEGPSDKNYWPDYCLTAEAGFVKQHKECHGAPHE